ncbi:MAG: OmpH family outer membrane protein [Paludibacteraceae bacterium]|nr:OmpH family outer membrane protein [Paludibacteraceae bacterium]
MKRILLILSVAIVLPIAVQAQQIAYINYQEVMEVMPELKVVQSKIDTLTQQYEGEFLKMRQEYDNKVKEFQDGEKTMPESIKEMKYREIMDLQQRIELFQQNIQQELQTKQREYMAPVLEKLKKAIEEVGKENNYLYILDSNAILYLDETNAVNAKDLVKKKLGL